MIEGSVTAARQPIIQITLLGRNLGRVDVEAIVDTGFSGYLRLHSDVIDALDLEFRSIAINTLADGREETVSTYTGLIDWDGERKPIVVQSITGGEHLLGMSLLSGCRLTVDAGPAGGVSIEADMCEPFTL